MAQRHNHYEAACEAYLRRLRAPYVAVDETRRTLLDDGSLKSMDFIIYGRDGINLLTDVKGRRFPSGADGQGSTWENWIPAEDIESLSALQQVFGGDSRGLLVFAYEVVSPQGFRILGDLFAFRGRTYSFYAVWLDDYQRSMRQRSSSWDTVSLPRSEFRRSRTLLRDLLGTVPVVAAQPV